jgi:ABC-type uncharacterized transport system permease subunit
MTDVLTGVLAISIQAGSVMIIAALGELLGQLSGLFNMGLEGTMTLGAVVAFIVVGLIPNPYVGLLAGILVGVLMGLLLALTAVTFKANQLVAGFAIAFLAGGVAKQIGAPVAGRPLDIHFQTLVIPVLNDIPMVGRILFRHDIVVYFAYLVLPALISYLVFRTRYGISIRACGENPGAADSSGVSVTRTRYLCALVAGAMAGLSGAYLVLAFAPTWYDGVTGGKGWIAVALVMFSRWRPGMLVLGALLFGIATSLGYVAQVVGLGAYSNILNMLPYLSTIALITVPSLLSRGPQRAAGGFPAALGRPYIKEEA